MAKQQPEKTGSKPVTPSQKTRSQGPQQKQKAKPKQRAAAPPPPRSKGGRGPDLGSRKWLYIVAGGIAVAVAVALILTSVLGGGNSSTVSSATKASVTSLLQGIPQDGEFLGSAKAPVTFVEFVDPQCPYCDEYSKSVLPTLIRDYVRPGKVRIQMQLVPFIGPDSVKAARFVASASQQNKAWNVLTLLYDVQGRENSGWVTTDLLTKVGNSVSGLDVDKALQNVDTQEVVGQLNKAAAAWTNHGLRATPSFLLGQTGGQLQPFTPSSLAVEPFKQALDQALAQQ